jgi:short subunit dehydrogenase-like uncharacterized protein
VSENTIVVYGSYGYTGRLIVHELRQKKYSVILAGRNREALQNQFNETGYPFDVVDMADTTALKNLLRKASLVIHCGGPFRFTAQQMIDACLETKTHYIDITGEWQVFELAAGYDAAAKQAGIQIMPGTGFDVVPSDCLAVHLKNRLPSATHLQLAFAMVPGGMSRGTKKSMTESLGYGGVMRKNNELVPFTLGKDVLDLDFGKFTAKTTRIQWGDISTAWRSTGIPTIEVFANASDSAIRSLKISNYLSWLLRRRSVKNFLLKQIDKGKAGPSETALETGKCYLRGTVWDTEGNTRTSLFNGPNAYLLTAKTAVLIAEKIMRGNFTAGYQTPAMKYGADLVLEVEGTERVDTI